jgi:hypothetical protein
MRVERLELFLLAEPADHLGRRAEGIAVFRQLLDETRVPFEELGELRLGQLPR